jgi:hypothetical protein
MRVLILFLLLSLGVRAQDSLEFTSPWEMLDHAYQNTSSSINGSTYLTNRTFDFSDEMIDSLFTPAFLENSTANKTSQLLNYLKWWNLSKTFDDDPIYADYFNKTQAYDYESTIDFPLVIMDIKANTVDNTVYNGLINSTNVNPYPAFTNYNTFQREFFYLGFLEDTIPTNRIRITLPVLNVISNKTRQVSFVQLSIGGLVFQLFPGGSIDLSSIVENYTMIQFETHFDDGSIQTSNHPIYAAQISEEKSAFSWYNYSEQFEERLIVGQDSGLDNPKIRFRIFYSCIDKKLHKPMVIFTGFGPHMWNSIPLGGLINWNQNWPKPYDQLLDQYNIGNQFEILREQGYDIVFAQVLPPNASINLNELVIQKVINTVNVLKTIDGCHEENIIMGFSAGALGARFALLHMEKDHLENNGPHHHSKLFISNDGENLGANVPLAYQHMLAWLKTNENSLQLKTRALYYIFHAPLAQELLAYYYIGTGTPASPNQGAHPSRTIYLNNQNANNHSLNTHLQGYPSFQRNISISNGSSTPDYGGFPNTTSHYPFPNEVGFYPMKQGSSANRKFEARYLMPGQADVFSYRIKPFLQPWQVVYKARTNNPRLLDDAPGGLFPFNDEGNSDKFISKLILKQWDAELWGNLDVDEARNFAFTPTLYTHDIRNYNIDANQGKLDYNTKAFRLNYINAYQAFLDDPTNSSNF